MTLTLFVSPGACSRVALVALQASGLPYRVQAVALAKGEQREPAYLALNPRGKVPCLLTPEGALAENIAIVAWLDAKLPQLPLLPPPSEAWQRAQAWSWLAWCHSGLHPVLYRLRMTSRIHPDPNTHEVIRAQAASELAAQMAVAQAHLARGADWLIGDRWCMADVALTWILDRAQASGLSCSDWPACEAMARRVKALPAWQDAMQAEADLSRPAY
jgi:glutathione S-transferase